MTEKITSLNEWKSKNQDEITLPSGVKVKIKRLSFFEIIKKDILPSKLAEVASKLAEGEAEDIIKSLDKKDISLMDEAMNKIISEMVISPPLQPKDVEELPDDDKYVLFRIAFAWELRHEPASGTGLENFREKQQGADSGSGGKILGNKTKCTN